MRFAALLLCVTAVTSLSSVGQGAVVPRFTDPARRAKLESAFPEVQRIFERFQKQRGIPGLVFGVVIDGELAFVKGMGVRDRASNDAVTADTVFRIASMTKSFTSLAILKLRDQGKLSLEDPVAKWIPEFARMPLPTGDTAPLRVWELLTHGAGFPEDNPWGDRQLAVSDEQLTRWLAQGLPFSTPPDTAYEYSNYGFALLGRIVAKASGVPYRAYLEHEILAPLGMHSSTLEPADVPANVRAVGYRKSGEEYSEEPSLAHGAFGSMGGLLTSAHDLARYVAYQLSAFPPRDDPEAGPVRRSSQREMQHAWRPNVFSVDRPASVAPLRAIASSYAYGLAVSRDCRFDYIVGHGGGLPGFGSYMMWLPEYGVGIFSMANLTYAGTFGATSEAFDALLKTGGLRPRVLPPSPELLSTRDAIVQLWNHWDDAGLTSLAANNLVMDIPAEQRRRRIDEIKTQMGACHPAGDMVPENLLRGTFKLGCEQGFVDVSFTLAPTMPPKVQYLQFTPVKSLDAHMKTAAGRLASLVGPPAGKQFTSALANPADAARLERRFLETYWAYGACRVGETTGGDGTSEARVVLDCDHGPVEMWYQIDGRGKVRDTLFLRAPGEACVR